MDVLSWVYRSWADILGTSFNSKTQHWTRGWACGEGSSKLISNIWSQVLQVHLGKGFLEPFTHDSKTSNPVKEVGVFIVLQPAEESLHEVMDYGYESSQLWQETFWICFNKFSHWAGRGKWPCSKSSSLFSYQTTDHTSFYWMQIHIEVAYPNLLPPMTLRLHDRSKEWAHQAPYQSH